MLVRERAAVAEQVDNASNVVVNVSATTNGNEGGQQSGLSNSSVGSNAISSIERMVGDPLSVHSSGSVTSGLSGSSSANVTLGGSSSAVMSSSTNSVSVSSTSKTKRVRTTFTEEQLQVLQSNFNVDSNPDGQDLERIAHATGLSKRVTQVWFQNSRARQKKYMNKSQRHASGGLLGGPVGPEMSILLSNAGGNVMSGGPISDRSGCLSRGGTHMDLSGSAVMWSPTGSSVGGGATGSNSNSSSSSSLTCTEGTGSSSVCDMSIEQSLEHSTSMEMMVTRDDHILNN